MKDYDHKKIEPKWQKEWEEKKIYEADTDSNKEKFYGLIEFPYPSGAGLHVGHVRSNTAMDIITRKRRMEGRNVLYPIGWDAFGLPTENYAIKTGIQPAKVTKQNTDIFRKQLKSLGFGFDWSREVNTTDPAYYKWTQWIFLKFYEKGLAYKAKTTINWCPKDKIGLANEEVVNGCCERCDGPVEKREKEQWMLAITKYADRLDKDLETVDYLEKIKIQQRNWIGRSEGSEIDFRLEIGDSNEEKIKVFTTRADTLFGVTYVVLSPEHPLIQKIKDQIVNIKEVEQYIADTKKKTEIERTAEEKDKTGVELAGVRAVNPANGEEVPVWVADYVLPQYGTGAVMAVPAHDERDFAFAKKYNLPIKEVVEPLFTKTDGVDTFRPDEPIVERHATVCIVKHATENKFICLKWKKTPWRGFVIGGLEGAEDIAAAGIREIQEETGYKNIRFVRSLGGAVHSRFYQVLKKQNRLAYFHPVYFELVDDERVAISEEENDIHDVEWVSFDQVEKYITPEDLKFLWRRFVSGGVKAYTEDGMLADSGKFTGMFSEEARRQITEFVGGKVVTKYKLRDWVFSRQRYWGEPIPLVYCEECGWVPVPEKELPVTLPAVESYEPTDNGESPLAAIADWVNTKCPRCDGFAKRETDTMPNWAGSSWYYLRYVDSENAKEFASQETLGYFMKNGVDWYNGGMEHTTLHLLYSRFWHKFLYDLGLVPTSEPYMKRTSHGMILAEGGEKMSKSKGNVVNPDDIVNMYGADTLRLYEMFMGPFDQAVAWSSESIIGPRRFLEKVWKVSGKASEGVQTDKELEMLLHKTIKKIGEAIEDMSFNTAVSSMMILVNEMERVKAIQVNDFKLFLQLLAPFAPHMTEELWSMLGEKKTIHVSSWPSYDKEKIVDAEMVIAVSINGKVRAELRIAAGTAEEEIKAEALKDSAIVSWTENRDIKRVIYVPGRLVNIVV